MPSAKFVLNKTAYDAKSPNQGESPLAQACSQTLQNRYLFFSAEDSQEHFGNHIRRRSVLSDLKDMRALDGFCWWLVPCALRVLEVFDFCQISEERACGDDSVHELIRRRGHGIPVFPRHHAVTTAQAGNQ